MERRFVVRTGEDLGLAIAEIRHARRITQAHHADQAGLSRHWLAKL